MVVMTPSDENETRQLLYTGYRYQGPAAVRYPRGTGPGGAIVQHQSALPLGKGIMRREGTGVAILNFGTLLPTALQAGDQLNATVADMRFVKPLDKELVSQLKTDHDLLVTLEEGSVAGGAGSAVSEYLADQSIVMPILQLGLPDTFVDHGSHAQQLSRVGLDAKQIQSRITQRLEKLK